jgi:alkanesulfonate monooxygenase SsuD/methylene tetrahydromethanopterin reductase-like flavin-dependent oxidoreductase (luciferase family)
LETSGIPAVIVSTTAFVQAADVQSKALGHEPSIVWLPHPIQDRTDEELRALADKVFDEIVARMTAQR